MDDQQGLLRRECHPVAATEFDLVLHLARRACAVAAFVIPIRRPRRSSSHPFSAKGGEGEGEGACAAPRGDLRLR